MFLLILCFYVLLHLFMQHCYYFKYYSEFIANKKIFLILLSSHIFTLICSYYYTIVVTKIIKNELIYIIIGFILAYLTLIIKKRPIIIHNQNHYISLFTSYFADSLFSLPQLIMILTYHYNPYMINYNILINFIGFLLSFIPISLSNKSLNHLSILLFVIVICYVFKSLTKLYPISHLSLFILCLFIIIVADFIYTKTRL